MTVTINNMQQPVQYLQYYELKDGDAVFAYSKQTFNVEEQQDEPVIYIVNKVRTDEIFAFSLCGQWCIKESMVDDRVYRKLNLEVNVKGFE